MERITDLERRYVLEVLDGQFRTSAGSSMTRRLEEKFAAIFGCRVCDLLHQRHGHDARGARCGRHRAGG